MIDNLSACLDGYRQSGQLDSTGEFTLSQEHAQKKLQDFTLPEARLYVLNLVAGCVLGEASYIHFRTDADELWMESDCLVPEIEALEELHHLVFSSSTASCLKELAIALNGVSPLKPSSVTMEVCDGKKAAALTWDGKQYQHQNLEDHDLTVGLKLHVKERLGYRVARKYAAKLGGGMVPDSEEDAVFRYCNRCPTAITFNGKSANRPVILGNVRPVVFSNQEFPPSHCLSEFAPRVPAPGQSHGLLAIGGRLAPWVTLIHHGVNFRLPEGAFRTEGLRGIVYGHNLRKDLSQVQLVQDEAFSEVLKEIQWVADQYLVRRR